MYPFNTVVITRMRLRKLIESSNGVKHLDLDATKTYDDILKIVFTSIRSSLLLCSFIEDVLL